MSSAMARCAQADVASGGTITERMARELLRVTVRCRFPSLRTAARAWGISPATLSLQMRGGTPLGPTVLARLGLEKVVSVTYRSATLDRFARTASEGSEGYRHPTATDPENAKGAPEEHPSEPVAITEVSDNAE